MPVYRCTAVYWDSFSGMSWTLTDHREEDNEIDALAAFNLFNTTYMAIASVDVQCLAVRVSDITVFRDTVEFGRPAITTPDGQVAGHATEIASCLVWWGGGGATQPGRHIWRHHGIASSLVDAYQIDPADPDIVAFQVAGSLYHLLFRRVETPNFPVVNPPVGFLFYGVHRNLYTRRLGRPITVPGQQRSYLRTA